MHSDFLLSYVRGVVCLSQLCFDMSFCRPATSLVVPFSFFFFSFCRSYLRRSGSNTFNFISIRYAACLCFCVGGTSQRARGAWACLFSIVLLWPRRQPRPSLMSSCVCVRCCLRVGRCTTTSCNSTRPNVSPPRRATSMP